MQGRFKEVEEQFFKLRGKLDTGRITRSEYEDAIRQFRVEDAQGRYWMIGADSGAWYYWDGEEWIKDEPTAPARSGAIGSLLARWPISLAGILFAGLVSGIGLVLVAALIVAIASNSAPGPTQLAGLQTTQSSPSPTPNVSVERRAGPTEAPTAQAPIIVATATSVLPDAVGTPDAPSGTDVNATPTAPLPSPAAGTPTSSGPRPTAISGLADIPTITPFAGQALPRATGPSITGTPDASRTPGPTTEAEATETATEEPTTDTSGLPPGVFVTGISVSPSPKRMQPVTFSVSFMNTTGQTQNYEWRVVVLKVDEFGGTHDWGQSEPVFGNIPPGPSQYSITYTVVTNPGDCILLQARASWRGNSPRIFFNDPGGNLVAQNFRVC